MGCANELLPGAPTSFTKGTLISEFGGKPEAVLYKLLMAIGCWFGSDSGGGCPAAIFAEDGDMVGEGEVDVIEGGELMRRIDIF